MVYYTNRTISCPHCRLVFDNESNSQWYPDSFGDPTIQCPGCKRYIKTGRNYWDNMNLCDRRIIYFQITISIVFDTFLFTILIILIILIILGNIKALDINNNFIFFMTIVTYLHLLPILIIFHKEKFRKLKNLKKK